MNNDEKVRMGRALKERYYLISADIDREKGIAEFNVTGSTGNVYKMVANRDDDTLSCDCPDFKFRRQKGLNIRFCKHGFFLQIRVLKNKDVENTWSFIDEKFKSNNGVVGLEVPLNAKAPEKVIEAFVEKNRKRKQAESSPSSKDTSKTPEKPIEITPIKTQEELDAEKGYKPLRPIVGEECGICYESLESGKLTHCKLTCGKAVHVDCFDRWLKQTRKANCVYCRSDMVKEDEKPKHINVKKQKTFDKRKPSDEGDEYINLQEFFSNQ
jgi:2-keto-3-deoxy-6-phosphogluconate aldolase